MGYGLKGLRRLVLLVLCLLIMADASVCSSILGDKTLEASLCLCWGNLVLNLPITCSFNISYSRDNSVILIYNQAYDLDVELGLALPTKAPLCLFDILSLR